VHRALSRPLTILGAERKLFFFAMRLGAASLPPAGTLSTVQLIAWFPVLFITFLASIYTLLKIPALTNHIFSGTAGESSAAILEKVFG
jgi:hypothetical protein